MKIGNEMKTYKKIIAGVTGIFIGVVQGISVNVMAAEANVQPDAPVVQVSNLQYSYEQMKQDLEKKLQEFASYNDNLEEVFENREQIEISRYYEKLPKPTLIAAKEYEDGKVYYKNPAKEKNNL